MLVEYLQVVEAGDLAVERGALLHVLHALFRGCDLRLQRGTVHLIDGRGNVGQKRQTVGSHFGQAAEHNKLGLLAAGMDRHDAGAQQRDHRRVPREHTEVAFGARDIDLIGLAGKRDLLRRDELEMERGHADPTLVGVSVTLLPRRAACPSRRPLRCCRPCRRLPPAGGRTCLPPGP